jgi:hypothetical protein
MLLTCNAVLAMEIANSVNMFYQKNGQEFLEKWQLETQYLCRFPASVFAHLQSALQMRKQEPQLDQDLSQAIYSF